MSMFRRLRSEPRFRFGLAVLAGCLFGHTAGVWGSPGGSWGGALGGVPALDGWENSSTATIGSAPLSGDIYYSVSLITGGLSSDVDTVWTSGELGSGVAGIPGLDGGSGGLTAVIGSSPVDGDIQYSVSWNPEPWPPGDAANWTRGEPGSALGGTLFGDIASGGLWVVIGTSPSG